MSMRQQYDMKSYIDVKLISTQGSLLSGMVMLMVYMLNMKLTEDISHVIELTEPNQHQQLGSRHITRATQSMEA